MITAFAYLGTSLSLALLFYIVAREPRGESEDPDMFRYPARLVRFVLILGTGFPIAAGLVIYSTFNPRPHGLTLYLFFGIWTALLVMFLTGYAYLKRFYIRCAGDKIVVHGLRSRVVDMDQAGKVVLVEGGRGGKELYIYDRSGVRVLKIGSSIRDFEDLSSTVRHHAKRRGIEYAERDKWGEWTRS